MKEIRAPARPVALQVSKTIPVPWEAMGSPYSAFHAAGRCLSVVERDSTLSEACSISIER